MGSGTTERWYVLCQLASVEQDSDKLIALIKEINRLLDEKEQRLKKVQRSECGQSRECQTRGVFHD